MIFLQRSREYRVEAGDERSEKTTCGRAHDAACARAGAACAESSAAGPGADLTADSAYTTSGRILHDADGHTENLSASFGTQHVGVGDIQVVAGDGDVEIVLERQRNRVIQ